ncbi:MAG: hypothetical protein J3R72DRAFT_434548 [Linnemannia gamsii]|nr:MAG: hypothetical protein J3R72DRAFT_434548 [Linnemannia gamsii]
MLNSPSQSAGSMSLSSPSVSSSGGGFQHSNTTGLESLESLASLSVLSPSLPVPTGGGSNAGGGGGGVNRGGGPETMDRKNSAGGYFSPSFQPPPSMPAAFQSHQQQQQGSYGSSQHHHHMEGNNQINSSGSGGGDGHNASPYPSTSSSFGMPSSMSSSLPMPSNFHMYSPTHLLGPQHQSQQQQQQQQHHPLSGYSLQDGSSPSSNPLLSSPQSNLSAAALSTFSRGGSGETRPRSRSVSPANHSSSPINRNTRAYSTSYHPQQQHQRHSRNNQSDTLSTISSSSSSSTNATTSALFTGDSTGGPNSLSHMTPPPVPTTRASARATSLTSMSTTIGGGEGGPSIPSHPRMIPARAPETGTPRKYHGRQLRKVPIPTIDLVSGVRDYIVPPTRRLAHILSEQKRREKINAGFEELKSVIPECAQNTDSKATILRKAVDRILELEQELRKHTSDFEEKEEEGYYRIGNSIITSRIGRSRLH